MTCMRWRAAAAVGSLSSQVRLGWKRATALRSRSQVGRWVS